MKTNPFDRHSNRNVARESAKRSGIILAVVGLSFSTLIHAADKGPKTAVTTGSAVLWTDPVDAATRDLYYGIGGKEHEPHGPYTFVKEDLEGTNPKFVVTDGEGTKWKLKLGLEARPETACSRLVWAAGYYTPEDYFVKDIQVSGMPERLQRGRKLVGPDGTMHNVRLKREPKGEKKEGNWSWKDDPFTGSREWNGLRTLMAVINNWDLKDVNNGIFIEGSRSIYMVTDLGASFASNGRTWPRDRAKDNLDSYTNSTFIKRTGMDSVDLGTPARPRFVYLVNPKEYFQRIHLEYLRRNVPRSDAKWLGELLSRLSPDQIRDAFRASGYSPDETDGFSQVIRQRIAGLKAL